MTTRTHASMGYAFVHENTVREQLEAQYDTVKLDPELPVVIDKVDHEALRLWYVLHPVPDGPRVLTSDKISEDGSIAWTAIHAMQTMALNNASKHDEFKQLVATLRLYAAGAFSGS